MTANDKWKIAFWNIHAGRKNVIRMVFGLSFVTMLTVFFSVMWLSYQNYIRYFNARHLSDCFYLEDIPEKEDLFSRIDGLLSSAREKQIEYDASSASLYLPLIPQGREDSYHPEVQIRDFSLVLSGKEFQPTHLSSVLTKRSSYESLTSPASFVTILYYEPGFSPYPEHRFSTPALLSGTLPEQEGEIVLSSYLLSVFGIETPAGQLVGKPLSLLFSESRSGLSLKDYVISGILNADYLLEREPEDPMVAINEQMLVHLRKEDRTGYAFHPYSCGIRYYLPDFQSLFSHYDGLDLLLTHGETEELSSVSKISLTTNGHQYCVLSWILARIGVLFFFIAFALILVISFSVLYLLHFYYERTRSYYQMLFSIGMDQSLRRQIYRLETGIILFLSAFFGLYFAVLLLLFANRLCSRILLFSLSINVGSLLLSLFIAILYISLWLKISEKNLR